MALTTAQKVTIAEITRKSYDKINDRVADWITEAAQETVLAADIVTWEANRNKLKVTLDGEVNYEVKKLLDEIRIRTLVAFGFSVNTIGGVYAGGLTKTERDARIADPDRASAFTSDLHL